MYKEFIHINDKSSDDFNKLYKNFSWIFDIKSLKNSRGMYLHFFNYSGTDRDILQYDTISGETKKYHIEEIKEDKEISQVTHKLNNNEINETYRYISFIFKDVFHFPENKLRIEFIAYSEYKYTLETNEVRIMAINQNFMRNFEREAFDGFFRIYNRNDEKINFRLNVVSTIKENCDLFWNKLMLNFGEDDIREDIKNLNIDMDMMLQQSTIILNRNIEKIKNENIFMCRNYEGKRGILFILPSGIFLKTEKKITRIVTNKFFENIKFEHRYIIDCKINENEIYCYDIMIYEDKNITKKPFQKRLKKLLDTLVVVNDVYIKNYTINSVGYIKITNKPKFHRTTRSMMRYKDKQAGILFIPAINKYGEIFYRWNKQKETGINFLIHYIESGPADNFTYHLYIDSDRQILRKYGFDFRTDYPFTDISVNNDTFPFEFRIPGKKTILFKYFSDKQLKSRGIYEFIPDIGNKRKLNYNTKINWKIVRKRCDKTKPDNFEKAMNKYESYIQPVTVKTLTTDVIIKQNENIELRKIFNFNDDFHEKLNKFREYIESKIYVNYMNNMNIENYTVFGIKTVDEYISLLYKIGVRVINLIENDKSSIKIITKQYARNKNRANIELYSIDENSKSIESIYSEDIENTDFLNFENLFQNMDHEKYQEIINEIYNKLNANGYFMIKIFDDEYYRELTEKEFEKTKYVSPDGEIKYDKPFNMNLFREIIENKFEILSEIRMIEMYESYTSRNKGLLIIPDQLKNEIFSATTIILKKI